MGNQPTGGRRCFECTLKVRGKMNTSNLPVICRGSIQVLGRDERTGLIYAIDRDQDRFGILKRRERINTRAYQYLMSHSHRHICRVYDFWKDKEGYWIFEEYVRGRNLRDLSADQRLTADEAVRVMLEVLEGLHFLHSANPAIIHRDLTLTNIMVDELGQVRIVDFGAARVYRRGLSRDTCPMGTPGYAAPEQFGFAQTDARTDIYAAGVLMKALGLDQGKYRHAVWRATRMAPESRYRSAVAMAAEIRVLSPGLKSASGRRWPGTALFRM